MKLLIVQFSQFFYFFSLRSEILLDVLFPDSLSPNLLVGFSGDCPDINFR
jgi:hypothetical protein